MATSIYDHSLKVLDTLSMDDVDVLVDLYHIRDGQIVNVDRELALLVDELLPDADNKYAKGLHETRLVRPRQRVFGVAVDLVGVRIAREIGSLRHRHRRGRRGILSG